MNFIKCDESKPYVFVSYKRQDAPLVHKDILALQHTHHVNVWFDKELEGRGSESWKYALLKIRHGNCRMVILYATAAAVASKAVQAEIEQALKFRVPIHIINPNGAPFSAFLINDLRNNAEISADLESDAERKFDDEKAIDYLDTILHDDITYYTTLDEFVPVIQGKVPDVIIPPPAPAAVPVAQSPIIVRDKLDKRFAILLCAHARIFMSGVITFASLGADKNLYWANPNKSCLADNWWLLLVDHETRMLHIFHIPPNHIAEKNVILRTDGIKPNTIELKINSDPPFKEIRSNLTFAPWLIKSIHFPHTG